MKTLLTFLASIIISCQCFADGQIYVKSVCSWGWKYKVKAKVNEYVFTTSQTRYSCNTCLAPYNNYPWYVQADNSHCAWQRTWFCNGDYGTQGNVYRHWGHCGRGDAPSPMMERLFKPEPFAPPVASIRDSINNTEKSDISFTTISETATSYKFKINGTMQIIGSDPGSELEILVWKPNNKNAVGIAEEDTIIDSNEILWRAFAKIVEGRLILEGEFVGDRMTFYSSSHQNEFRYRPRVTVIDGPNGPELGIDPIGGGPGNGGGPGIIVGPNPPTVSVTTLRFSNFEKTLTWPASENKDSLIFVFRSHASGTDAVGRISQVIENTDVATDIKFDVFPNPAKSSFDVSYMTANDGAVELSIFNELGEFVGVPDKKYLEKGKLYNSHFDGNALGMSNGIYYVMLQVDGKAYLRKMVMTGK